MVNPEAADMVEEGKDGRRARVQVPHPQRGWPLHVGAGAHEPGQGPHGELIDEASPSFYVAATLLTCSSQFPQQLVVAEMEGPDQFCKGGDGEAAAVEAGTGN